MRVAWLAALVRSLRRLKVLPLAVSEAVKSWGINMMQAYLLIRRATAKCEQPALGVVVGAGALSLHVSLPHTDMICLILFLFLVVRAAPTLFLNIRENSRALREAKWDVQLPEVMSLANRMDVHLDNLRPLGSLSNLSGAMAKAGYWSDGPQIIFGESMLERLDMATITGIGAHELAHIKNNVRRVRWLFASLIAVSLISLPFGSGVEFSSPASIDNLVTFCSLLSMGLLACSLIQWRSEYAADSLGARFIGVGNMISALQATTIFHNRDEVGFGHPSISSRIGRLERGLTGRTSPKR